jgi:hypothetical protein
MREDQKHKCKLYIARVHCNAIRFRFGKTDSDEDKRCASWPIRNPISATIDRWPPSGVRRSSTIRTGPRHGGPGAVRSIVRYRFTEGSTKTAKMSVTHIIRYRSYDARIVLHQRSVMKRRCVFVEKFTVWTNFTMWTSSSWDQRCSYLYQKDFR